MTDKCKVSIVVPDYKTTPGGKESEKIVAPFEGRITHMDLWSEKDKPARLIFFESSLFDLYIHLWNALKSGRIWSFNIRIMDKEDEKPTEKKEEETKR